MTSASDIGNFLRIKCKNKYSKHRIKGRSAYIGILAQRVVFLGIKSIITKKKTVLPNYILQEDVKTINYLNEVFNQTKNKFIPIINYEEIYPDLGSLYNLMLSHNSLYANTDIFWKNSNRAFTVEVKDRCWEFDFPNIGDVAQISVFHYLYSNISPVNLNLYIYYTPNDKLLQINPLDINFIQKMITKMNYDQDFELNNFCIDFCRCK